MIDGRIQMFADSGIQIEDILVLLVVWELWLDGLEDMLHHEDELLLNCLSVDINRSLPHLFSDLVRVLQTELGECCIYSRQRGGVVLDFLSQTDKECRVSDFFVHARKNILYYLIMC